MMKSIVRVSEWTVREFNDKIAEDVLKTKDVPVMTYMDIDTDSLVVSAVIQYPENKITTIPLRFKAELR